MRSLERSGGSIWLSRSGPARGGGAAAGAQKRHGAGDDADLLRLQQVAHHHLAHNLKSSNIHCELHRKNTTRITNSLNTPRYTTR